MLNERQAKFSEFYAVSGNAAESAKLAGYSAATSRQIGSRLLSNVDVKRALAARQEAFRSELRITKADVIKEILAAIDLARGNNDPGSMIRGCSLLARMLGFYEPERLAVDVSVDAANLSAKYAAMSDAELMAIASASG